MRISFNSQYTVLGVRMPKFEEDVIKSEPMLFSADWKFARQSGGKLTHAFMDRIGQSCPLDEVILDSRVHMLMPGWYPCIPGWHLDDVPRNRPDGQPNHESPSYKSQHISTVVGDASLTEFVSGVLELDDVPIYGGIVYGKWNKDLNNLLTSGHLSAEHVREGDIVRFNCHSFHRGMPATKNGWRFFIRASWQTDRMIKNEIRQQTQIYLPAHEAGW